MIISLFIQKRLQIAATLPKAVCEWLQLLPTYVDFTLKDRHGLGRDWRY